MMSDDDDPDDVYWFEELLIELGVACLFGMCD